MNAVSQQQRHLRVVKARGLRREMGEPEKRLWQQLRQFRQGTSHFRRQAPIGPYFADFACHEQRIVIEIDGETHGDPNAMAQDEIRGDYLRARGYLVLRFWNNDVMNNIDGVMMAIHDALAAQEPPPLTPPRAARGRGTP